MIIFFVTVAVDFFEQLAEVIRSMKSELLYLYSNRFLEELDRCRTSFVRMLPNHHLRESLHRLNRQMNYFVSKMLFLFLPALRLERLDDDPRAEFVNVRGPVSCFPLPPRSNEIESLECVESFESSVLRFCDEPFENK